MISIIIPTYKPGPYLWECLESICAQTLNSKDWEVILILNGDKEPYWSEIRHWIADHAEGKQIHLLYEEKASVSQARNRGLDAMNGEYVTMLDDDDYVSTNYLEELMNTADKETVSLSNCQAFYDENHQPVKSSLAQEFAQKRQNEQYTLMELRHNMSGPCMKLWKKEMIGDRRFDLRFKNGEDSLFIMLISNKMHKIRLTDSSAIYYRRIRKGSANFHKRSYRERSRNMWALCKAYSKIYFSNPREYSFAFYITRILGAIKSIVII